MENIPICNQKYSHLQPNNHFRLFGRSNRTYHLRLTYFLVRLKEEHFKKIEGANVSKVVNNVLNAVATKNLLKQFVWDADAPNSFQNLKNILSCIHSALCSKENTQSHVNNVIKNALKNARAKW